jgi:hypothetical protein
MPSVVLLGRVLVEVVLLAQRHIDAAEANTGVVIGRACLFREQAARLESARELD